MQVICENEAGAIRPELFLKVHARHKQVGEFLFTPCVENVQFIFHSRCGQSSVCPTAIARTQSQHTARQILPNLNR